MTPIMTLLDRDRSAHRATFAAISNASVACWPVGANGCNLVIG
jgi:hypothetical protein